MLQTEKVERNNEQEMFDCSSIGSNPTVQVLNMLLKQEVNLHIKKMISKDESNLKLLVF